MDGMGWPDPPGLYAMFGGAPGGRALPDSALEAAPYQTVRLEVAPYRYNLLFESRVRCYIHC